VFIARNKHCRSSLCQRDQVVIARITRSARRPWWIGDLRGRFAQNGDYLPCGFIRHPIADLGVGAYPRELVEKLVRYDQLELTAQPSAEEQRRRAGR
jgi:hypothetical protein